MKQSERLVKHAKSRTDQVRSKLREAMLTIEHEIEQNDGIYPFHGGRLSLAEVCRRAGVHKITMQGPAHIRTTKPMVERWLAGIANKLTTGRKAVRKKVTERADGWKERYLAVARKLNEIYAIEVIEKNEALAEAASRIAKLEAEILQLRTELSQGKVVKLPRRK